MDARLRQVRSLKATNARLRAKERRLKEGIEICDQEQIATFDTVIQQADQYAQAELSDEDSDERQVWEDAVENARRTKTSGRSSCR